MMRNISILILLLCSFQVSAQDKLIFALDLIRHGDRTPIYDLPEVKHTWQQGHGQLTDKGLAQEYELGVKFRKKYILANQLLPSNYQRDVLYVRSTDFDRTLMSAQAVLLGLYPPTANADSKTALPGGYQPIPIHSQPLDRDELVPYTMLYENTKPFLKKHGFVQKEWSDKTENIKHRFAHWSKATGMKVEDLSHVAKMSDNLIVYQNHNVALPPGLSKQDINDITLHGKWAWASLFKPKAIGATMGSGLLATVTHYLQDGSEQQKPLKYVLLSGHDSSILSLLSAMQVALDEPPPYASVLNFSVFETKNRGKKIVASLNDKPIFIPHCKGSSCTPAQFSQLLAHSKDHIDTQALAAIHAEDRTQARVH